MTVPAVLVALLLLAGCGEEDPEPSSSVTAVDATDAATAEPSAEPSPEPSLSPPPMPPAAAEQTPAGAEAFTRWWFDLLNYAFATGDLDEFRAVSPEGCGTCDGFVQTITDIYARDSTLSGGQITLSQIYIPPGQQDPARIELLAVFDQAATIETTSSGTTRELNAALTENSATMQALWDGKWVAAGVVPNQ